MFLGGLKFYFDWEGLFELLGGLFVLLGGPKVIFTGGHFLILGRAESHVFGRAKILF